MHSRRADSSRPPRLWPGCGFACALGRAYDGEIAAPYAVISFGRGSLSLRESEVARLVGALSDLNDRDADAVVEEMEALTLAGLRVDLRLNDGEIGALMSAITRIITSTPGGSHPRFNRLLTLVRDEARSASARGQVRP